MASSLELTFTAVEEYCDDSGTIILIHPQGGRRVICFCFQSFELRESSLRTIPSHFNKHEFAFSKQDLNDFLLNCQNIASTATLESVPCNVIQYFPSPTDLSFEEIDWCIQCGQAFGNSHHNAKCMCSSPEFVTVPGLVSKGGRGKRRISPLVVGFPSHTGLTVRVQEALHPNYPSTRRVIDLKAEVAALQMNVAEFKQQDEHSHPPKFTLTAFEKFADSNRATQAQVRVNTVTDKLNLILGMTGYSQDYLDRLFLHTRNLNDDSRVNLLDNSCDSLMSLLNNKLAKLDCINQTELFRVSGKGQEGERSGAVKSVSVSTLRTYNQIATRKLVRILYHCREKFRDEVNLIVQSMDSNQDIDTALCNATLSILYSDIVREADTSKYDAFRVEILPALFLTRASSHMSVQDDSDSESEQLDEEIDDGLEHARMVTPYQAGRICAALKFLLNSALLAAFDFSEETSLPLFIDQHANCQIPKLVNRLLHDSRALYNSQVGDSGAISREISPNGLVTYVTNSGERFTTETLRKSTLFVKQQVRDILSTNHDWTKVCDQFDSLLFENFSEGDFKIESIGQSIVLTGSGFDKLRLVLHRAARDDLERFLDLFKSLKVHSCCLINMCSSGLLRVPALFNLHSLPGRASEGNLFPKCHGLFGEYSYLVVNGLSSKHVGEVETHAVLSPRVSKLVAVSHVMMPAILCLEAGDVLMSEKAFCSTADIDLYRTHLNYSLFRMTGSCRWKSAEEEMVEFGTLDWHGKQNLLVPLSFHEFSKDLLLLNRLAIGSTSLTHPTLRKIMANTNQDVVILIKSELDSNLFSLFDQPIARAILDKCEDIATRGKLGGFGDGGAHTQQTFRQSYAAREQGTNLAISLFEQSSVSVQGKMCIGRDFNGLVSVTNQEMRVWKKSKWPSFESQAIEQGVLEFIESRANTHLKEEQQQLALCTIAGKDLVYRVGCGEGKTWVNLMIASVQLAGVTMFLVPTRALQTSIEQECQQLEIHCEVYRPGDSHFTTAQSWDMTSSVRVVIAVFDSSVGSVLVTFMREMKRRNLLNRIVVDEVHQYYECGGFRPLIADLSNLRDAVKQVPLTLMSGTLNGAMVNELGDKFKLDEPALVFKDLNLRNWLEISVERLEECNNVLQLAEIGTQYVMFCLGSREIGSRTIVFAYSVRLANVLQNNLTENLPEYEVGLATSDTERVQIDSQLASFAKPDNTSRILVCTSILAIGVNFKNVSRVIVLGSYGVTDLIQKWSRCGRGAAQGKGVYLLQPVGLLQLGDEMAVKNQGLTQEEGIRISLARRVREVNLDGIMSALGWKSINHVLNCTCVPLHLENSMALGSFGDSQCGVCSNCTGNQEGEWKNIPLAAQSPTKKPRLAPKIYSPQAISLATTTTSAAAAITTTTTTVTPAAVQVPDPASLLADDVNRMPLGGEDFINRYSRFQRDCVLGKANSCLACGGNLGCFPNRCEAVLAFTKLFPGACYYCGSPSHSGQDSQAQKLECFPISNRERCFVCMRDKQNCANVGNKNGGDPLCEKFRTTRNVLLICWYSSEVKREMIAAIPETARLARFLEFHKWATEGKFGADGMRSNSQKVFVFYSERKRDQKN